MFLDELSRILRLKVSAEERITLAQRETQKVQIAEEAMELERVKLLRQRYAGAEIEARLPGNPFSDEETIDLGTARDNKLVWDRPFKALYITECKIVLPGTDFPVAYIRFNDPGSSVYQIRTGFVKGNFSKLFHFLIIHNTIIRPRIITATNPIPYPCFIYFPLIFVNIEYRTAPMVIRIYPTSAPEATSKPMAKRIRPIHPYCPMIPIVCFLSLFIL
ncbi:unnamed protein product, partial [marine sediment metagenome]